MGAPGAGGLPDLSRIVGKPLPVPGMPKGTISVRVSRKIPVNAAVGVEVSAIIKNAGGDLRKRTQKTDDSGHALFEGINPGDQFQAEVNVDGEHLQTETFSMPDSGGLKTMLIAGLAGGGGGDGDSEGGGAAAPAGGGDQRAFALGATAGNAVPEPTLPAGTLEVVLRDEKDAPIGKHPVVLGIVNKTGGVDVRRGTSDETGVAKFTGLPVGKDTGLAAVIDWHGLRLNTAPFAMPDSGGVRAEIRALARTSDPSVVTIGAGGRIVLQMHEDSLNVLELLPLENTSDKMFDPGPGAFEIPLPEGFVGAQPQDNERKVDVRQNHGMAVHGAIVPKRSQLATPESQREQEVVFGFVLPYHGDTREFSQPAPNGIGALTLIIDQKLENLSASGPGVGARREQLFGGHKYWAIPIAGVPPGGNLTFTLTGLPSHDTMGPIVSGVLALLLVVSGFVFARRPDAGTGPGGKRRTAAAERAQLVDRREELFAELVSMERAARTAGTPPPVDQRRQLVGRLEQVYQDIAALDEGEPRAA
ncbi:MAG TPA: hypothetical protein VIF57_16100 [Polyangia bacterium]